MDAFIEPELMTDEAQVSPMPGPTSPQVNQGFVDRFRVCSPRPRAGTMVDLGCGPGDIPCASPAPSPAFTIHGGGTARSPDRARGQAVKAAAVEARVASALCPACPCCPLPLQSFRRRGVEQPGPPHARPAPLLERAGAASASRGRVVPSWISSAPNRPSGAREIVEQVFGQRGAVLKEDFFNSLCAAFTLREIASRSARAGWERSSASSRATSLDRLGSLAERRRERTTAMRGAIAKKSTVGG